MVKADKKVVAGVAAVAVMGVLSYLGYRVIKELNELDFDFMGENIHDDYHYQTKVDKNGK